MGKEEKGAVGIRRGQRISNYSLWLVLLGCILFLSVATPNFLTLVNLFNILLQISIIGIISIGMTFVILTRGIDLSVGSLIALCAVISGQFAHFNSNVGLVVPLLASIIVGTFYGLVFNGLPIAIGKITPFIVTLSTMLIARGLALLITGAQPVFISNADFLKLASINIIIVPLPVIIFALVWLLAYFFQKNIPFSSSIYTVGDDPDVAFLCGIKIRPVLIFVYALSGLLTGLAGAILASRVASGEPAAGVGYEFSAIAAAVIGGTSLFGGTGGVEKTVVGLLIIGVINNGMNMLNIASYFQQIALGIIIIIAVLFDGFRQGKLVKAK